MCDRIDSPVIRAGLSGVIWNEWLEPEKKKEALVEWILAKLPAEKDGRAGGAPASASASAATESEAEAAAAPCLRCRPAAFLSLRFPSQKGAAVFERGCIEESTFLRKALEARGIEVLPALDPGKLNRATNIFAGIDRCDLFVVFGTESYGANTGNPMCTHFEFSHAMEERRPLAWIKMCPRIRDAAVRGGLSDAIHKEWEESDAMVDWITARIERSGSLPPLRRAQSAEELVLERDGAAASMKPVFVQRSFSIE